MAQEGEVVFHGLDEAGIALDVEGVLRKGGQRRCQRRFETRIAGTLARIDTGAVRVVDQHVALDATRVRGAENEGEPLAHGDVDVALASEHFRDSAPGLDAAATVLGLEWKWGIPVWSHDGLICTGETYKKAVKMTFAKGASLDDPAGLFNSSLDGNVRRAIDVHEGDALDEKALKALIRAAVALNKSAARG